MEVIIDNIKYETTQLDNGKWTLPEEIKKCLRSCCGALNIDGNRVPTNEDLARINKDDNGMFGVGNNNNNKAQQMKEQGLEYGGRYPAQTFINSEIAQVLDKQSGNIKSNNKNMVEQIDSNESTFGSSSKRNVTRYSDTNGCSKILHKCDYEEGECDLYFYNPKVSKNERNAGCDGDEQQYSHDGRKKETETPYQRNKSVAINHHPTLKPIKLNKNILALFKTPNEQRIVYPFAGSGSEIIGGIKAGFNNWCGCEISQDYIDIALARIEYWSNFEGCEVPETTEVAEGQIDIWELL
jgi:gas vesicle protein